jgi:hypothetical protein
MARPNKENVDYFPHDATGGKTMFTLESKFGNDGYAFWFKLLEALCNQEGLFIDRSDYNSWSYLVANARVSEEKANEILNLLAKLNAIDADLWTSGGIIWIQNLVDRLEYLYKKRKSDMPLRPSVPQNQREKLVSAAETPENESFRDGNPEKEGVIATETPQSKVKQSKDKDKDKEGQVRLPDAGNPTPARSAENGPQGSEDKDGATPKEPDDPVVVEIPLNDGSAHPVTESQRAEWQETYPAVDVMQQLRAMVAWCKANPKNKKTKGGANRFVVNWLGREQNRARASPPPEKPRGEGVTLVGYR